MLTYVGVALVLVIVIVVGLALTKPDTSRLQRSAVIGAPPDRIFPHLVDFHAWGAWSPWEKLDPNLQRTFSGSASGRGAIYAWQGNKKVGSGRMEILQADAPSNVVIKLDFITPFEAHNTTTFTLAPQGSSTHVTWLMEGPNSFMTKLMSVFMNFDKLVGKDFEAGLANLKRVAEG